MEPRLRDGEFLLIGLQRFSEFLLIKKRVPKKLIGAHSFVLPLWWKFLDQFYRVSAHRFGIDIFLCSHQRSAFFVFTEIRIICIPLLLIVRVRNSQRKWHLNLGLHHSSPSVENEGLISPLLHRSNRR